jgi:hypothetical protein
MKGIIHKTDTGWEVVYWENFFSKILPYKGKVSIPVLSSLTGLKGLKEGDEVEFEIMDFWETGLEKVFKYAKIMQ